MKIKTSDKIVQRVLKKMDDRSLVGQEKYGSTMHDEVSTNKKNLSDFLIDVQEEIMDALLYIEAARACLQEEVEEVAIKQWTEHEDELNARMDIIGQNGNEGLHYDRYVMDSSYPISKYP